MGNQTTAAGDYAVAMGQGTGASAQAATAMGTSTAACGNASTAMGIATEASGNATTAMGIGTRARAYGSVAIEQFNTFSFGSRTQWFETDPLLIAGNGSGDAVNDRSDALVLYKNGDLVNYGQHQVFLNSSLARAHLLLYETEADYARLRFRNTMGTYWDVAGLGATS